jgi:hypothetical protein
MDRQSKLAELQSLRDRARALEDELVGTISNEPVPPRPWQVSGYYAAYYATTGFLLGSLAACTSLLFNVVGSVLWPSVTHQEQHPLRLIQVYLTFPMGEAALNISSGLLLTLGCVLYLGTGMLYGMVFQLVLSYFIPMAGLRARLIACSVLAIAIWLFNFYGVLIWLQPLVFGGRWIIDLIPWWVAALTHLVFGWTMAVVYPLGVYERYQVNSDVAEAASQIN